MKWFTKLYQRRSESPVKLAPSSGSINSVTFDLNPCVKSVSSSSVPLFSSDSAESGSSSHQGHVPKSILRKDSKYGDVHVERRARAKKIKTSGGLADIIDRRLWEAKGFLWPENIDRIPMTQQVYMLRIWDLISSEVEDENLDLESYEIVEEPPEVVDLTLYDVENDEDGVFAGGIQPIMLDRVNSVSDLVEPDWILGYSIDRSLSESSFAKIESTHKPTCATVADLNLGELEEDPDEIERYRLERLLSIQNSLCSSSKDLFDKGRLVVPVAFHQSEGLSYAGNLLVKQDLTAKDIEIAFGLSDRGTIILNLDHIVVYQGYCGFNRGKAKIYHKSVPKGKDALKESVSERFQAWIKKKVCGWFQRRVECIKLIFRGHPRNKTSSGGPGESVGAYAMSLANDSTTTFARNIENFICCTKESREAAPQIVMRNMRQFMSGMKNYLVKHGEGDFQLEVQRACSRLKPDEFLNLDTILEGVMQRLVVLPLREHLYGLFVEYYTRTKDIQLLVENVRFASGKSAIDMGIRKEVSPPTESSLRYISMILQRLQEAEQPLEKLDYLLAAVSAIFEATGSPKSNTLCADDFLPILVYVVAKSGFIGAEIEAEFMWGLLQPSLLSGEAGYYLTALCSAAHVLKTFKDSQNEMCGTIDWRSSAMPACSSVLRVIIPDEYNGSLQTRTLPVRPHTTTKEVCRIIAHKARITNPQDYGLFKLVDGEETLLMESECPQDSRLAARGKHWMLAYKRIDAKIAWPTHAASSSSS
ncbi:Protein sprint [Sergentomyia squamirostris]